jgi:hypothetical protein
MIHIYIFIYNKYIFVYNPEFIGLYISYTLYEITKDISNVFVTCRIQKY